MQLYVDLIKLDCFLSTLEEELREISRLENILEKQYVFSLGIPIEEERILERRRYLSIEREKVQSRKNYLMKAQELFSRAADKNKVNLESALQRLQRLN